MRPETGRMPAVIGQRAQERLVDGAADEPFRPRSLFSMNCRAYGWALIQNLSSSWTFLAMAKARIRRR